MRRMKIGEVAKQSGVGAETLRFYERRGLIAEPARLPSGYRVYQPEVLGRLRFIRRATELGFSLDEVKELLDLRVDPDGSAADVRKKTQAKVAEIDARIASLQQMRDSLQPLIDACDGQGSASHCPILDNLFAEECHVGDASPSSGKGHAEQAPD